MSAGAFAMIPSAFARAITPAPDFSDPAQNLSAFLKLQSSTERRTVWQWAVGRMDLAATDEKIVTLVEYESLWRRDVRPLPNGNFEVRRWEASYFRDPETGRYAEQVYNPIAGRPVTPFHFSEGPFEFVFSQHKPRVHSVEDVLETGEEPWLLPWTVAGDDVWVTREHSFAFPNPVQPDQWPLESSGEQFIASSRSTYRGRVSEVRDPKVATANADFLYQGTSSWLPWMLMGQRPGWVVWRAHGRKFLSQDELPESARGNIGRLHPRMFAKEAWSEPSIMLGDYPKLHQPVRD